jgi:hypothetical protein
MMRDPLDQFLESFYRDGMLSVGELWFRCFELGGMNSALQIEGFLHGVLRPSSHEYNLMAVAFNEYLMEKGLPSSVPYIEAEVDAQVQTPEMND